MSYARVQPMFSLGLEELAGFDTDEETRVRRVGTTRERVELGPEIHRIPTPSAIVRSSVRPGAVPLATIEALPRRQTPTIVTFRTASARRMAWPIFLCGFIAGVFGGLALMKSPVGKRPVVQYVVKKTNLIVDDAIHR